MAATLHWPIISPILVGRNRYLEAIDHLIMRAGHGQGQTVLIGGEAGIGKSRLIAETRDRFVARVAASGIGPGRVLEGHCFEADRALPYAPLRDLLRGLVAADSSEKTAALGDPTDSELLKLLPELSVSLATITLPLNFDPEHEKRRLFQSLTQLFFDLSGVGPLFVVIEDLHWSDDISLDFLLHLARHVSERPIVLLLSYRSEEVDPDLRHMLAELDRGRLARELVLPPLTITEVDQMLSAIFGHCRAVRPDFLHAVYELTEGNPFFIEEVLRSLSVAGDTLPTGDVRVRLNLSELHIPRSVQDAVQRRVAQLSATARQVLAMAAVTGRRFDFAVLREVTGRDEREVVQYIKELIAAQLVVQETGEWFAFRHALTRQAVYGDLLAIERKALHRVIAEVTERVHADAPDVHAGDLAYHYEEARVWPKALEYALRAGEQAMTLYSPRAAVEHFTRALDSARHVSDALPIELPIEMYRARGRAFEILGDFGRARGDLEQSLELARAAGDKHTEWQALLDLGLLWASRDYTRTGEHYRQGLALVRTMNNPATLGRSLNRLGNWYVNVEQPRDGRRNHEEALTIFEGLADQRGIAETLDLLGMAQCCSGDLQGSMTTYERAAVLFRELDDRSGLVMSLALLASQAGDYHFDPLVPDRPELVRAVEAGEEAMAIARAIHWRAGETFAGSQLGQCLATWGKYDRALAVAHEAERIADEIDHRQWLAFANEVLGRLYLDLRALPTARHHLEQALRMARETNALIWCHAASGALISTCVQQGDLTCAEAVLAAVPGPMDFPQTFGQRLFACAHVELALARRQPGRALYLVDQLMASLGPGSGDDRRLVGPPHLGRLRGEALAMLGRVAEAEAVFQADLATARARACRPPLWRLHAALGHLYRAHGRRAAADREFTAARTIIDQLATEVPDEALRNTFRQHAEGLLPPPRPPTALRAAKQAFGGLTRREREVAALIAENKTNREIAQELFVGERTVATHVSHILTKLNLASRTEITAWARDRGLVPPR